jgi:GntR family transcriptional regulator
MHERIRDDLRERIISGDLAVGEPVPTEAELRLRWSASRGPVRQALTTLRSEGLIGGGRGKPAVVRRREVQQPYDSLVSFSHWAKMMGMRAGQRTVEMARRPAPEDLANLLDLDVGEPVVQLIRQRSVADSPVMVERATFTGKWGALLLTHDPDAGSIYEFLIGHGLTVGIARHGIDAVPADSVDSELLGVDLGSSLLREVRVAYTEDGEAFEFSDDRYRPDRITFTIDNSPDGKALFGRTWFETTRPRPERFSQ